MVSSTSEGIPRVITLDGLSGSGKSTLARLLANQLGWIYLDSGAWYRALTWVALKREIDVKSTEEVLELLLNINIDSTIDGSVVVDGIVLGEELRSPKIDKAVSSVADHVPVRKELNRQMRKILAREGTKGIVADGRDVGSVVFPNSPLKVFVEAPLEERARRRFVQHQTRGLDVSFTDVFNALQTRDVRDSQRGEAAPQAQPSSYLLENQNNSVEQAVGRLLSWSNKIFIKK